MSNFQTIKNSLKKLELKQEDTDQRQFCGVISQEAFEKLEIPATAPRGNQRHIGYLIAPRRLTEDEWEAKYGAQETF